MPPAAPPPGLVRSHPWYDRRHHDRGRFRTPDAPLPVGATLEGLRFLLRHALQTKENRPAPLHTGDAVRLREPPRDLRVTWLGHTTLLIQTPQATLLTDPVFARRVSPLSFAGPRRLAPLPLPPAALPPVDTVLLSHDHYDHLDRNSVRFLQRHSDPLFVAPLGVAAHLHRWGVPRTLTLDWWQHVALGALRLHCTPAQHFSGRSLLDRNRTLWASWYLDTPTAGRLYFAGDTAYNGHFATIRERLGAPDVALLPIGANRPRALMQPIHMDPPEAARAAADLQARHVVPTHWGTFDLALEPVHEPIERFRRALPREAPGSRLHVLALGEAIELDGDALPAVA